MKYFNNLAVIGTSHISKESIMEVETAIDALKPGIVALELDLPRFQALFSKKKPKFTLRMAKELGIKGSLFALIGAAVERKLGKMVGTKSGDEMKAAAKLALKNKIQIALIDRDLRITLDHLFKYLTWKEKWNFAKDIIMGMLGKGDIKEFDLNKVPEKELIEEMIKKVNTRYPSFHKALIEERNAYMAKALYNLIENNKELGIIAIVGAGHEDELIAIIKKEAEKSSLNIQKKSSGQ